jgi:MFS family permease
MCISVVSYIDRQALYLLVDPIKHDLRISDTLMSILMGPSFAVFYAVCGIPLARVADTKGRRMVILFGCVAWSFMTAGCGLAQRYWQLLLMRMGVGVGEATLNPSAYSLITDYFPKERVATAISVFSMGMYVGGGLALVFGGAALAFVAAGHGIDSLPFIGTVRPWQQIFILVGLPGLVLAPLMLTVRESPRQGLVSEVVNDSRAKTVAVPLQGVLVYFRKNWRAFLGHHVGFGLIALAAYGGAAWIPTYLHRNQGMDMGKVGVAWGAITVVASILGVLGGGVLADRLAKRGYHAARMRVGVVAAVASVPACIAYPLAPSPGWALVLLFPVAFFVAFPWGAAAAAIQEMVPRTMRSQAAAVYVFVAGLISQGLGPTAVALVTDFVFRDEMMVRFSLMLVCASAHLAAAAILWASAGAYQHAVDRLAEWKAL